MRMYTSYLRNIIFCFFIVNFICITQILAGKTVYIYTGPGVAEDTLGHTQHTLRKLLPASDYQIEKITPSRVIEGKWRDDASLFVVPGGADRLFAKKLDSEGNKQIRAFVEEGGSFLGICGGAYYAGNRCEFDLGTDLEVAAPRELAFFPGPIQGPTLAKYNYKNYSGTRAAKVLWKADTPFSGIEFRTFYNAGGHFPHADSFTMVTILATYGDSPSTMYFNQSHNKPEDLNEEKVCIVECQVGRGKAILSLVHPEVDPEVMKDTTDPYLLSILPDLLSGNENRLLLISHLLHRLGIKTNQTAKL